VEPQRSSTNDRAETSDSAAVADGAPGPRAAAARSVLVVGPHRCGTSMVTRALELLGVGLGPAAALMNPQADNPLGFFEHRELSRWSDDLLQALGGTWDEPPALAPGWENDPAVDELLDRARSLVERDLAGEERWAFKDPRTSLLLPVWRRLAPNSAVLICLRHPLDAARSLQQREGFDVAHGTRLWAVYLAFAILGAQGAPRAFTRFERSFEDPAGELRRLGGWLGLEPSAIDQAERQRERWIQPQLRHHRASLRTPFDLPADEDVDPWCLLLWRTLGEVGWLDDCRAQSDVDRAHSDDGERQLLALSRRIVRAHNAARNHSGNAEAERLRRRLADVEGARRDAAHHILKVEAHLAGSAAEIASRDREIANRDLEISTASGHIEKVERILEETARELERTRCEVQALREREDEAELGLQWVRARNEELAAALRDNAAMRGSAGWRALERYRQLRRRLIPSGTSLEGAYRRAVAALTGGGPPAAAAADAPAPPARPPVDEEPAGEAPSVVRGVTIAPPTAWRQDPTQPPVVVAIAHWNRVALLRECLDSLRRYTTYPHYRICVFDQGSTDGSHQLLLELGADVDVVFSPANVGFVRASNAIAERYPEWDVVFLNNDTRVTRGWLRTLARTAGAAENIGLVGVRLVYPDGRLQEAGCEVYCDGSVRALGRTDNPESVEFHQRREVDFCSAACLYVKRAVLERVGAFEECYSPGYYEDVDLSFKARAAGFKTVYEPNVTVYHHEYGTAAADAHRLMERNQPLFVARWRDDLATRPRSQWRPRGVDWSAGRPSVLYVGDIVPAVDRSAGGGRLHHLLRALAREANVAYAYLQDYCLDEYLRPLERHGVTIFHPGLARAVGGDAVDLGAVLREARYDVVICALYEQAERCAGVVRRCSPHSRFVVDSYDLHYVRELRAAELRTDEAGRRQALATKERELAVYRAADAVLVVTEEEREILRRELGDATRVEVLPTFHEAGSAPAPFAQRSGLLFVGGFSHAPNVDAVLFLVHQVLPLVLAEEPAARLRVVGNSPTPEILALDHPSVEIVGYAPHLEPFLQSARVAVAPMRYGSGMKGKIAEAMVCGLPVVTTPVGAEGMDLSDGVNAMVASTPEELAERVVRLLRDEAVWQRVASAAREQARARWSPEVLGPAAVEIVRSLAASPRDA
jgi:GT2 family glycosyltransferase